jgi:hypothetical protein
MGAIAAITNQIWEEPKLYGIETRKQLDQPNAIVFKHFNSITIYL